MKSIDKLYLSIHKRFRSNSKRIATAFFVSAVIVFFIVIWWLKLIGITVTTDAFCGIEEHIHNSECYTQELICTLEENTEPTDFYSEAETTVVTTSEYETYFSEDASEAPTDFYPQSETTLTDETEYEASYTETETQASAVTHIHNENCYHEVLICTETEHIHTADCFPDKSADTETVSDWLSTFEDVEITNNISENLVAIAVSQKGYEESVNNFELDEDGSKNGYTRYGEWYGNPYGKWNAMFVSFCLHYSNINNVSQLKASGAEAMRLAWDSKGIYSPADDYTSQRGDLLFSDKDADGICDNVAIILSVSSDGIIVISGDSNNRVESTEEKNFASIMGYGLTGELSFAEDKEYKAEETTTAPVTQTTAPAIQATAPAEEPTTVIEQTVTMKPNKVLLNGAEKSNIIYTSDLSAELTSAVFKTTEGTILGNGDMVYVGQKYIVALEFSEINSGNPWIQFRHNADGFLTYQIPSNLQCDAFTSWHTISATTENGSIEDVGEYFVNDDGLLLVRFFEDSSGVNFVEKYTNVSFNIEFNTTIASTQSGTSSEVVFNDEISIELNVDGGAGMTSEKSHGSYNPTDHTLDYTIKIEATNGVVNNLVVNDEIWEHHFTLRDTIIVTDLDGNLIVPQPTISNHPYHNDGANEGFSLSGFPSFSAGEGFLITYKTQVYDEFINDETVDLWNGVYSTGSDSNGDFIDDYTEDWLRVELEKMEKEGRQVLVEDDNGNEVSAIEWEIEIKKNNEDLQGTVIIDTLGEGLSYFTDKSIRIKCYDEAGNRLDDVYLSWDQVTVNGSSMTFALPAGYAFDIIYYTTFEALGESESKQYTNSVSAVINGTQESTNGSADVVGFVPEVSKDSSGNDGEYAYFTIEAEVPSVIKDLGNFYLNDLSAFWSYNDNGDHRYVENLPEDLVITAVTQSGQTITFTPYVEGGPIENTYILQAPAENRYYHSFYVYFNTAEPSASSSKWMLSENATLYVSYKLSFDRGTGTAWSGEATTDVTLGDMLLEGHTLANEAYLNYTDIIEGIGTTTYEYSPGITKESMVHEDGTIDYTVVFHNTIPNSYGDEGYLNNSTLSAYFDDTFDERLEYVPGSMMVTCYDPWRDGLWMNKYVYNGDITGNTMHIHASEFVFSEYNPAAVEVGWGNLYKRTDLEKFYKYVNAGGDYVFTYSLRVKDEYLETTEHNILVLDNTAQVTWNTDGSSGPAHYESEFETGLIDKEVVQNDSRLDFSIHINRRALDILSGTETLTIEDTMSANLSVYWDTIGLYYEDASGNWIDFDSASSQHSYTVTYDHTNNKLTFVVPDELHIRIDYTTLITESGLVSVNNSVKIDGKAQVSDIIDAIFTVNDHSGGASGSRHSITLLKQDGSTDLPLPDVTFHLYGPVGKPDATIPDTADSSIVAEDNTSLYYIGSYTTGDDGTVLIDTQYLTIGGPYALVEPVPPAGYNPLDKPVYFYFYTPDPDGIMQTVTTIVVVENYTYGFVLPETGGPGILHLAIIGISLMGFPVLYSIIRRKRERRST